MKLEKLTIELQPSYAKNAGKYESEITYEGKSGKLHMLLDDKVSEALLAFIGPTLTQFSHQAALEIQKNIELSVREAQQAPALGAQTV